MNSAADSTQNQTEGSRGLWTVKDEGEGTLRVYLEGNWELDHALPKPEDILASDVSRKQCCVKSGSTAAH